MRIWVDADACPKVIKEILYRAAKRTQTQITLVANQMLVTPPSPFITKMQVPAGFDVADDKIVSLLQPGDLVITADIPLADAVVSKGCKALNPRGELYSEQNIKERLALRNLSEGLRSSGMRTGGPATLSKKEIQEFANQLDQILGARR
jgi:uncharacterized protein YaiI (UPF0178 family)